MRAHQFITEITRIGPLDSSDFESYAASQVMPKHTRPLPGGNHDLSYSAKKDSYGELNICIWNKNQMVATMVLEKPSDFPIKKARSVGQIFVLDQYKGQGLGKSMYGIALALLKIPLIAGNIQSPDGRRAWVSLNKIPGVIVKGWVMIPKAYTDNEDVVDELMGKLGGQYIGTDSWAAQYWAFDIVPNKDGSELEGYINSELDKVYEHVPVVVTGLYATWNGQ